MDAGLTRCRLQIQKPVLSGLGPHARIGVFRALQLGDMLCAVPALRALRAAAPSAHITLIGLPWADTFVRRFHRYLDAFACFPGYPGLPEQAVDPARIPAFLSAMQEKRFDLIVQMHGSGLLTNPLVASLGAARYAGFYTAGNFCPDARYFMQWNECRHEILRGLDLMQWLGIPAQGEDLEFPLTADDHRGLDCALQLATQQAGAPLPQVGEYVCIHPGARMLSRRWHAERFAEVGDRLQAEGLTVVLTGASEERELVQSVERTMCSRPVNLCGKTNLGAFAALVAGARLVISNDTGTSHVATAVKTPSIVVSCGSDHKRWAPLDATRHRTLLAEMACRPCMHQVCPTGHACADQIQVSDVVHEALDLMGRARPARSTLSTIRMPVQAEYEGTHERNA